MGMNVTFSCDRPGCSRTDANASAWYSVRNDNLDRDVWLCSTACLQAWAAQAG